MIHRPITGMPGVLKDGTLYAPHIGVSHNDEYVLLQLMDYDDQVRVSLLRSVYSIEPPQLYKDGFSHGNCGGFCIKAGQAHFAHLLKTRPETYAYHEEQERQMREYLGKDVSVLKDRRGGTTKPMTLSAFRLRVETGDYDHDEWGGCGCAVS